jgi:hypothetical protein
MWLSVLRAHFKYVGDEKLKYIMIYDSDDFWRQDSLKCNICHYVQCSNVALLQYPLRSWESNRSFMRMNVQCWFHNLHWDWSFNEVSRPIIALLLNLTCRVLFLCNNCTVLARQRVDCRCCGRRVQGGRARNCCLWSGVGLFPRLAWSSSRCCCPKWQCADLTCQAAGEGQTLASCWRGVGGRKKGGH